MIITQNLNGWMPVNRAITYGYKLHTFASYLKNMGDLPEIVFFQEMIAGVKQKYLTQLKKEFPEYEIIPPEFDYKAHYKSIMVVTLIRRDILDGYTVIYPEVQLLNRLNYVVAVIKGEKFRLINVHAPQIVNLQKEAPWYSNLRRIQYREIWQWLHNEAGINRNEKVLIGGDLQESSKGTNVVELMAMGYKRPGEFADTVCNNFFSEKQIDHLLFSESANEYFKPTIVIDNALVGTLSDHGMLYAVSTIPE